MAADGPRDWSPTEPPRYGVRVPGWQPAPVRQLRRRRGFGRGLALSLLVIPPAVVAWVLLWQVGIASSIVAWLAAVGAGWLFKKGSGGVVSRRGAWALTAVIVGMVVLCVAVAVAWDVALGRLQFTDVATDAPRWLTALVIGVVFGVLGIVPVLLTISGRRLSTLGDVLIVGAGIAMVIAVQVGGPSLSAGIAAAWPSSGTPANGSLAVETTSDGTSEPEGIALRVGDCLAPDPAGVMPIHVTCDQPHVTEVFHEVSLGADPFEAYPGDEQVYYRALERCSEPFHAFVGVPHSQSTIGLQVHRPMASGWAAGERTARCLAITTELVTGTVQGTAR